ncbi:hypothetical protein DPEC_G00298740 [Dallia pectoralis]|uniref:Uncharacterized protein n=1 Tax=Dallia pectoralis TaxID=75939 RepID=A0ACC2FG20_DALPE|nr:hypothetical protein DPEC_G00298740 [Dallia pectoralis]
MGLAGIKQKAALLASGQWEHFVIAHARSPTKVDTSTDPDMVDVFRRISCFKNGKAEAGNSSDTVTVYDCRMLGMAV